MDSRVKPEDDSEYLGIDSGSKSGMTLAIIMKILQIGNPILERKANRVHNASDPKVQQLITNLVDMIKDDQESAGLAAPQIGKSLAVTVVKKVRVVKNGDDEVKVTEIIPLINPEITSFSEAVSVYWEGCLSVGEGENRLFGPVERPKRVNVKYIDRDGNPQKMDADGFFSHLIQHEVDHLNGVLFLKYISNPQNIWKSKDLDKYLEKYGELPPVVGVEEKVSELIV